MIKNKKSQLRIIMFFLPYLFARGNGLARRYIITALFVILTISLNILVPISAKYLIETISAHHISSGVITLLVLISFGLLWTSSQVISQCRQLWMFRVFERCIRLLGTKLFEHLNTLSMDYHKNQKTGAIINSIDRAQAAIPTVFWGLLFLVIPTIIEVTIAAVILTYLYGYFYGCSLLLILVLYVVYTFFASQKSVSLQRISNEKNMIAGTYIVDRLLNYETLQCLVINKQHELNRCDQVLREREDSMTQQLVSMSLVGMGQMFIIGCGITLLTFMAAKSVLLRQGLTVSDYVLISGYLIQFAGPLNIFGVIFRQMRQGLTDLENMMEILDETPEIVDQPEAVMFDDNQASVTFNQISFSYRNDEKILDDLSFTILEGQTVAIIGPTGCGKTTISNLLFRFYETNEGFIEINGKNIKHYTIESLRSVIGIVPQNAVLFNDTIRFNITYSNPELSEERLHGIIQAAHLEKFISSLPQGLETTVGEQGLKLSGGERQRIAIARALVKNPRIFIFDEATSSLDTTTEHVVQNNLLEISRGITTLIIAHRLSTITHADKIIMLDENGKIIASGKHKTLLANNERYAQMWYLQSKHYKSANEKEISYA